jgi:hypothetical protein
VLADTQNGVTATNAVTDGLAQFHNTLWWDFTTASGNQTISNTATNLGRNTVTTNYWTDPALTNQIADPMLTSISRTNSGVLLDPRPKAGSPASSDYASAPAGLVSATYRGAFASGRDNWIADWTALSEYGIVTGAGGNNAAPVASAGPNPTTPNQPTAKLTASGNALTLTFSTQVGFSYQVQSATALTGQSSDWTDEGTAVAGTGSEVSRPVDQTGSSRFFRIKVQ